MNRNPIFCAFDMKDILAATALADRLLGAIGGVKLGLEYVMANGPQGCAPFVKSGMPVFVDVKLHDIPNTVAGAVTSLLPLEADFINVHASGGAAMMRAAAEAAAKAQGKKPKLLAVTILTSLDASDLKQVGMEPDTAAQVKRLALLAKDSGMDGVVCSPAEIKVLREACGPDFILMVPGIRPAWSAANDQKRITTPREAMDWGASYLVIGRPITGDADPAAAARRVMDELNA